LREPRADLPPAEIERLARSNDSYAQGADRQLRSARDLRGIVVADAASVDERNASVPHDGADLALDDETGVLVDAQTHQLGKLRDRDKKPIQSPPLSEVRVDQSVVAEKT
jgi:hypothetical protein